MGNNFPTAEYLFNHKDTITHNIDKQRALVLIIIIIIIIIVYLYSAIPL